LPHFIPWYRREEYGLIREVMDDGDEFPLTFDEWEKNAENERAAARREGVITTPVFIDSAEFFTFCDERKISPNSAARANFARSRGAASYSLGL
jgi:hypothetical protein